MKTIFKQKLFKFIILLHLISYTLSFQCYNTLEEFNQKNSKKLENKKIEDLFEESEIELCEDCDETVKSIKYDGKKYACKILKNYALKDLEKEATHLYDL